MKSFLILIACCWCSVWGFAQEMTKEKTIYMDQVSAVDSFFTSSPIDIVPDQATPFTYLSAYTNRSNLEQPVFYRTYMEEAWTSWQAWEKMPDQEAFTRVVFKGMTLPREVKAIQLKTTEQWEQPLYFRQFIPGHSAFAKNPLAKRRTSFAACEQPDYCDRDCWCPNGNCPEDPTPVGTGVTHIIVHHSAANTRSNDFPAVVRSYWDFHVNTRGWDDIGYNWLIDANGVIYESRGAGRLGAHFSCMNEETVGICLIGSFINEKPTPAALEALQHLIAWEAHKGNLEVSAQRYHPSSRLDLPIISGHLDGSPSPLACSSTVCPGDSLYSELPYLRESISALSCGEEVLTSTATTIPAANLRVHPNPSTGTFTISFESTTTKEVDFALVGIHGNTYELGTALVNAGSNDWSFSIQHLPSGFYAFTMQMGTAWLQEKVVLLD